MKHVFIFGLLLFTYSLRADMPGNKPRPDYSITISGLEKFPDYSFFSQANDSVRNIINNSLVHIPGGYGAPAGVAVWAVSKKTQVHTDTLYFSSGESDTDKAIQLTISENHLSFTEDSSYLKTENSGVTLNAVKDVQNTDAVKNKNIMYFISGLSFLVLAALVFFIWNKTKKPKDQSSI